jgi:iron complex transport system ATP-binding protein
MRIEARELFAGYDRRPVVHGLDLCVGEGELVGLIGPNGAGKSTLLRALSGALPPIRGAVTLDGRDLSAIPARERARSISFVPQTEPALFDFTVRDVVLMGRYAHQMGRRGEQKGDFDAATRAMSSTDTLHLADRPITSLSGGEHRRVLLARALAQQAPLMLLDEPTAHLDVTHQSEVLALLGRLVRDEGAGALAALHDLNLAADSCDRLVLIAAGRIVTDGTPDEVMTPVNLSRAYGGDLRVTRNPASGRPFLVTTGTGRGSEASALRIHVICGGGTGLEVLSALHRRGYRLTAGVLNRLDSDEQAAAVLSIPTALEAPFSPIGEAARLAADAMIREADVVVVTAVPLGKGNLANLELALQALLSSKPVFLLGGDPAERDFTRGAAVALWQRLREKGARLAEDLAAVESELVRLAAAGSPDV